jgi:hypothetical protein
MEFPVTISLLLNYDTSLRYSSVLDVQPMKISFIVVEIFHDLFIKLISVFDKLLFLQLYADRNGTKQDLCWFTCQFTLCLFHCTCMSYIS